jgi:hypothetical protein
MATTNPQDGPQTKTEDSKSNFEGHVRALQPDDTGPEGHQELLDFLTAVDNPEAAASYNNYTPAERTNKTEADYVELAARMIRNAVKEGNLGTSSSEKIVDAISIIITKLPKWSKRTWRYYKAALTYYIESELLEHNEHAEQAIGLLLQTDTSQCRPAFTGSGPAKKRKSIPKEDLGKLIQAAGQARAGDESMSRHAVEWLVAATITGLRPIEWRNADVAIEEVPDASNPMRQWRLRFTVRNAKATNGRAHGPERKFLVSTDVATMRLITRVHERTSAFNETDFGIYLKNCRQALRRLCKRVWPRADSKHYTLYTGRHQFSANQKSSGKSKKEVSYLMGHKVTKTAVTTYGKRRQGWGSKPEETDITPDDENFDLKVIDNARDFHAKRPESTPGAPKNQQ